MKTGRPHRQTHKAKPGADAAQARRFPRKCMTCRANPAIRAAIAEFIVDWQAGRAISLRSFYLHVLRELGYALSYEAIYAHMTKHEDW